MRAFVTGGMGFLGAHLVSGLLRRGHHVHVFDQEQGSWFKWGVNSWKKEKQPKIRCKNFAGTGTRFLNTNGKKAIKDLFEASFKK